MRRLYIPARRVAVPLTVIVTSPKKKKEAEMRLVIAEKPSWRRA